MSETQLRKSLIRLAAQREDLRPHLLPLLAAADSEKGKTASKTSSVMSTPLDRALSELLTKAYKAGRESARDADEDYFEMGDTEVQDAISEFKLAASKLARVRDWKTGVPRGVMHLSSSLWELAYWAGVYHGQD